MSVSIANQNKQIKGLISVSAREIFLTQFFRENENIDFFRPKDTKLHTTIT